MGNYKGPTEGGSGGKRGHSSMEHWTNTEELKDSSRKHRRKEDKEEAGQGLHDTKEIMIQNPDSASVIIQ